ncbi:MAG: hypothetical protein QOE98_1771 [Gaiellaceae bacterium]|jgi:hypothetical protein|nr:hypothetical protein [Gaiellaceae bacterium]
MPGRAFPLPGGHPAVAPRGGYAEAAAATPGTAAMILLRMMCASLFG